jgi:colicin import membrane protein
MSETILEAGVAISGDVVLDSQDNTASLFVPNGLDIIIGRIRAEVSSHKPDISTEKGRKAISSLARKIASSKVRLDDMGKSLVAELKAQTSAIDSERKRMRDELDTLRDETRRPLTEWEDAEKARIEGHESALRLIWEATVGVSSKNSSELGDLISSCRGTLEARGWQEFQVRAQEAGSACLAILNSALESARLREFEAAEIARLRKAESDRLQAEREQRIKDEASAAARLAAETEAARQAAITSQRAEHARQAVELRAAQAERAAQQAMAEASLAVERERQRAAEQLRVEEQANAKREANRRHCGKINRSIVDALSSFGLLEETAKKLVASIAKGEIPSLKILY